MSAAIVLLLVLVLQVGCGHVEPDRVYRVTQDFRIRVVNQIKLKEEYYTKYARRDVRGWHNYQKNEIVVPYSGEKDKFGRPLPDFETLGHEIWHLKELGGKWHD